MKEEELHIHHDKNSPQVPVKHFIYLYENDDNERTDPILHVDFYNSWLRAFVFVYGLDAVCSCIYSCIHSLSFSQWHACAHLSSLHVCVHNENFSQLLLRLFYSSIAVGMDGFQKRGNMLDTCHTIFKRMCQNWRSFILLWENFFLFFFKLPSQFRNIYMYFWRWMKIYKYSNE